MHNDIAEVNYYFVGTTKTLLICETYFFFVCVFANNFSHIHS